MPKVDRHNGCPEPVSHIDWLEETTALVEGENSLVTPARTPLSLPVRDIDLENFSQWNFPRGALFGSKVAWNVEERGDREYITEPSQMFTSLHPGVDFFSYLDEEREVQFVPERTLIYPVAPGIVMRGESEDSGSNVFVVIDHGGGFYSLYGHLGEVFAYEGVDVETDLPIARLWDNRYDDGERCHLHFALIYGRLKNLTKHLR